MKTHIIITVLLAATLGLNAQRPNSGSRSAAKSTSTSKSAEDEKKSKPAKSETRTKESSAVKPATSSENRKETPVRTAPVERKAEPSYNESRNREKAPVRTMETPRKAGTQSDENRSSTTSPNSPQKVERPSNSTYRGSQEPERKVNGQRPGNREAGNRNSNTSRTEVGTRNSGNNREANVERNRVYTPRTDQQYVERRQAYRTPERHRIARTVNHSTTYVHQPIEYRRSYYPYSEPRRVEIIWDLNMYNEYRYMYPQYDYWYYPYGYSIHTISAYDADRYIGEIARIYGRVSDVYYERETDEFTLFFGEPYPYQDFSVILSGKQARRFSRHPERYFTNRNIAVTGLVSLWDEKPEMIIKKRSQLEIYF